LPIQGKKDKERKMGKKVLGRGLNALISMAGRETRDRESNDLSSHILEVPLGQIVPNPYQPRKHFNEEKLKELIASIKENGIIQPIVVTQIQEGYQIVVGERRWRAAKEAGFSKMPVIVKDFSPQDRVALALVENLQRDDLNPLEEAQAFHLLAEGFGLTQEDLSQKVGRSRPYITNTLRLLNLPENIKTFLMDGKLTAGHARALLSLDDPKTASEMAEKIIANQLSVRETENMVKKRETILNQNHHKVPHPLEIKLQEILGARIRIRSGTIGGKIEIAYRNPKELEEWVNFFTHSSHRTRDEESSVLL
jgi:ParB family chromosome partitioning protein